MVIFPAINFAGIRDRKSTRLNSSHLGISYAVFCLKKKKKKTRVTQNYLYMLIHTSYEWRYVPTPSDIIVVVLSPVLCSLLSSFFFFFFFFLNDPAPPKISPFPLPAPLPI